VIAVQFCAGKKVAGAHCQQIEIMAGVNGQLVNGEVKVAVIPVGF